MRSIGFPRMFSDTSTLLKEDYNATLQNLMALLHCEKGELFGDPFYGMNIKRYLFDQNSVAIVDILIDDIYEQLAAFMPQLSLKRKDIKIKQDGVKLLCEITATNNSTYETNLYNLVLYNAEED